MASLREGSAVFVHRLMRILGEKKSSPGGCSRPFSWPCSSWRPSDWYGSMSMTTQNSQPSNPSRFRLEPGAVIEGRVVYVKSGEPAAVIHEVVVEWTIFLVLTPCST